ncbi:MAG: YfhO family protein [Ruminococcus sp.]|nr:YfhO family protein [Ruminococcus sp.]
MAKAKAVSAKEASAMRAARELMGSNAYVKNRWAYYLAAFLIPALLTFIAYALFKVYPFGGRSVLCLDLNGQYVYFFESLRDAFWGDNSALYSWSRNLSGGYMGIIGYYLASPFTLIVMLLPKRFILESLMIMQIAKVGAAGTAFCVYAQRSKNVPPLASVMLSTSYALMAYVAIQLIDPMWIDGPVFLPLVILGVEYLVDDGRKINYIIPLAIMFIANFYIGFMVAIFVAIYFVYYLFFGTKRKIKGAEEYGKTIGLMVLATAVVLMCSYIMIMPVYKALALGKFDFSEPDYSLRTMFNPIELVPTLLPDQYYSVNVDEGTRMYGRPEIYCGVLSLVLLPLYYLNRNIKRNRKIGYSMVLFVMFFSMWIKPINMLWHGGQDPNWLPYRYSFIVSFIIVSMAAEAFANLDGYKLSFKSIAGVFAGLAVLVFLFEAKMPSFNYNEEKYKYVAAGPYSTTENYNGQEWHRLWLGTMVFGLALAAVYLICLYLYSHQKNKNYRRYITLGMAALVLFEAGYNTYDTFWKVHKEVYYSEHDTYDFVKDAPKLMDALEDYDPGFYRAEKTFFRTVNDNQAFGLKGISHSSSVMNSRIIRFIETLGYSTKSYETRYDGNTPLADSLLGIKYVINDPTRNISGDKSILSPYYEKVFSTPYTNGDGNEATADIYENKDALAIGCMVDDDILKLSFLGNDDPFNSMNNFMSSLTGNTPDYSGALVPKAYFYRVTDEPEVVLNECWESDYGGQHCYNANAGAGDPTVNIHITAQSDDEMYMFLKSDNQKGANLWISTTKDENGNFIDHKGYGGYFDGYEYSIVDLGSYPAGTEMEIRLTIRKVDGSGNNEYIMIKDFQFYHFNYEAFHEDIQQLKQNEWKLDMDKTTQRHLVGEIDAQEGQIMYTSIPYEPGWTIKVDGKKVDDLFVEDLSSGTSIMQNTVAGDLGQVVVLNALIGLRLPAGHHTVSMKYTPPGFNMGIFLLIAGIAIIVFFWYTDRKKNVVMIAQQKIRERVKAGLPPFEEEEAPKKAVDIIKSKGAVKSVDLKDQDKEAPKKAKAEAKKAAAEEAAEEKAEEVAEEAAEAAETAESSGEMKVVEMTPLEYQEYLESKAKKSASGGSKPKNKGGKKKKKK